MTNLSHEDYTVGWICALPLELAAAKAMLDEVHEDLPAQPNDHNAYTLGRIGKHNIVISCLPSGRYGLVSASTVATQLLSSFQSVKFGLLVGVGGGVPNANADVRLGDVVVGIPTSNSSHGVVQYDFGKVMSGGRFKQTGALNSPPQILLTAVSKLRAIHRMERSQIPGFVDGIVTKYPQMRNTYMRPEREDQLFDAQYQHPVSTTSCVSCDRTWLVNRPDRKTTDPMVHYGPIASGNKVIKDSKLRDRLSRELGAYCVEMEAAGLMNSYPCLVVRGICDYADSHKDKDWQGYAAAVAVAYAKELLLVTSDTTVDRHKGLPLTFSNISYVSSVAEMKSREMAVLQSLGPPVMNIPNLFPRGLGRASWSDMLFHEDYRSWYRGENVGGYQGLMWVKGKPGSGKSTFMRYAFHQASEELLDDGATVAGFFFQAQGKNLQWSQLSLLRTLFYQLFQANRDDLATFMNTFHYKSHWEITGQWSEEELKSYFRIMFSQPRKKRTILFVDGLDECQSNGLRGVALFFRQITTAAHIVGAKLSVCLSSREYPKVSVGNCPEILIHHFNTSDIRHYVEQELSAAGAHKDPQWSELEDIILSKSNGVFLWVVLVVDGILKDNDEGRSFKYMRKRLEDLPPALEQLYSQILSTVDREDIQMTLKFFYWVVLAAKPLRLVEWHQILSWIRDEPPASLSDWRESDYFTATTWQLERQIRNISKGLVEVTMKERHLATDDGNSISAYAGSLDSEEGESRIVQVIHGSVSEYFLYKEGFSVLDSSTTHHALGIGDLSILNTCLDYIFIPELDSLVMRRRKDMRKQRGLAILGSEDLGPQSFEQQNNQESLSSTGMNPESKPSSAEDHLETPPLGIITEALIQDCLQQLQDEVLNEEEQADKVEEFLLGNTLLSGDFLENAILQILWRHRNRIPPSLPPPRRLMARSSSPVSPVGESRVQTWRQRGILKRSDSEASFGSSASSYAASVYAASVHSDGSKEHPLSRESSIPLFFDPDESPVQYDDDSISSPSVNSFHIERFLWDFTGTSQIGDNFAPSLSHGSLTHGSERSETLEDFPALLFYAVDAFAVHAAYANKNGTNPERLLHRLESEKVWQRWVCLAEVISFDTTLLDFAAEQGLATWVTYLLFHSPHPVQPGQKYMSPLIAAVGNGDAEIFDILLKEHEDITLSFALADVSKADRSTLLHQIARKGQLDLLFRIAHTDLNFIERLINVKDDKGRTPLHLAVRGSHIAMTEILLVMGADPVTCDKNGNTLLHYACQNKSLSVAICHHLLSRAAKRHIRNNDNFTASQVALHNEFYAAVSLLNTYPTQDAELYKTFPKLTLQVVEVMGQDQFVRPYILAGLGEEEKVLYCLGHSRPDAADKSTWNQVEFWVTSHDIDKLYFSLWDVQSQEDSAVKDAVFHVNSVHKGRVDRSYTIPDATQESNATAVYLEIAVS